MLDYLDCSLTEIKELLDNGTITSVELTRLCLQRINDTTNLNALISTTEELALQKATEVDARRARGEKLGVLAGIPIVIKDIINLEGTRTTCASKFLENFVSPYTATCAQKLIDADAVIVGKANMDEFAMGSSNENSAFGACLNPVNPEYVPGGSSGGSACTVAAKQCFASLGTDTGGSIREPASFCGIVGLKPTYGRVSRYGVIAFASSCDQVGPMTRTVKDNAIMLNVLAGKDEKDMTSSTNAVPDFTADLDKGVQGLKIGLPKQFFNENLTGEVREKLEQSIEKYKSLGAEFVEVDLPSLDTALAVYYILTSAEATSNLSRFDGIKYGRRAEKYDGLIDLYFQSRTEGFGKEVKRRIMLGNYVLSSGYFDAFYRKAKKVQVVIKQEFDKAFKECDVILSPTTGTTAFKIGEKSADPVAMYLTDIYTVPVNIAGIPAISIPCGRDELGLPVGMQLMGKHFDESTLYRVAYAYEQATKEGK